MYDGHQWIGVIVTVDDCNGDYFFYTPSWIHHLAGQNEKIGV